ncbi:MAG: hypothetical protein SVZ03_07760 [Spirochaetota bacterium]|nr:hypothetical protein [Spirochaetota bacterium]
MKENKENRFTISLPMADDPVLVACPKCSNKVSIVPYCDKQVRCSCL